MTLTTLSSKELGPLYRWSLRRNRTLAIVYSILLIVIGPVVDMYVMASSNYISMTDLFTTTIVLYGLTTAFFVFISAIINFSFLHNKRSVDMYGSLPTNRTTMFISHLLSGITVIGVPYLAAMIVTMGLTVRTKDDFILGMISIISTLLMIAASYLFTALIAYCCGTVADTVIITIAVNVVWVLAVVFYYGALSSLIPGMDMESVIYSPALTAFAPYGFGLMNTFVSDFGNYSLFVINLIWNLLYIAGVFFLTLYVANKRKSECSQSGFAVKWLPMVITASVSVVAGFLVGYVFAEVSDSGYANMFIYVFWHIIASLVAFVVLQAIFRRGLKGKLLPSIVVYLATLVASVLFVIGLTFGYGIDTYVPSPDSIKSVECNYVTLTEPENIRLATEIHQVIADGIRKDNNYPYYFGYDEENFSPIYTEDGEYVDTIDPYTGESYLYSSVPEKYPYVNYFSYAFLYERKIGFNVMRVYYIYPDSDAYDAYDLDKLNELTKQLVNSEEYKKQSNSYIWDESERANDIPKTAEFRNYYYDESDDSYSSSGYAEMEIDEEFTDGLYEALRKDILADNNYCPIYYNSNSYGNSYINITISGTKKNRSNTYYNETSLFDIDIKESYKNTMEYLAKADISMTPQFDYNEYYSDDLENYYCTGEESYLKNYIKDNMYMWASQVCSISDTDFNDWYADNYSKYQTDVLNKADELIDSYSESIEEYDYDTYTYYQCKTEYVMDNLSQYIVNYIAPDYTVGDSDIDSDSTDTESKAESKTESKVESKTESKVESKNESKTESETSSKDESVLSDTDTKAA